MPRVPGGKERQSERAHHESVDRGKTGGPLRPRRNAEHRSVADIMVPTGTVEDVQTAVDETRIAQRVWAVR
jgi:hypothetical protein